MKITALVENTAVSPAYKTRHGLSLYIETAAHKILFDLGPDELFLKNAKLLNVDISAVDTVVISHGHNDHGGALGAFFAHNDRAKVYVQECAFGNYYDKLPLIPFYIYAGLDATLKAHKQIVLTRDVHVIDESLTLFSGVTERECASTANGALFAKGAHGYRPDLFEHEHNLIITENGNSTLFSGCSHSGIINIQKKAEEITGKELSYLIGGFHLYNPTFKKSESSSLVTEIANRLNQKSTSYYTCHCTGKKAYGQLKAVLGDKIDYLATGRTILHP